MSRPSARANRILVWMCVLIAINQLGFGSMVRVMALYARSYGVLQSAIGVAIGVYGLARFLVAVPAWQLGLATDLFGASAALASAAALLMAVALLFARYAPETYKPGRF